MRARILLGYGLMAAVAAACSNPDNEQASRSTEDLLSELEPALLASPTSDAAAVLSAAELSVAEGTSERRSVAPPRPARAAPVEQAAHVPAPEPALVQAPAAAPGESDLVGSVAVSGPADHAGHAPADRDRFPGGIMIRGGVGRDPCVLHPGMLGPESVAGFGGTLGAPERPDIGPMGAMINDRAPRVGRAAAAYPGGNRNSGRPSGGIFIR